MDRKIRLISTDFDGTLVAHDSDPVLDPDLQEDWVRAARVVVLDEPARRGDADAFVALIEERQVAMTRVATAILRPSGDHVIPMTPRCTRWTPVPSRLIR